ncbi:hypothetical protein IU448_15140 [Nocardia flavorosea]|uniref:hypothetical protein n=1 Tax=Nocardia flavorosea TaxID=53429 RepID=UPI0018936181|nr:hypothetical protein [Nocardia flavorosea]MBF6350341.1 hypothetical protein [Nocardia flavorosea]
MPETVAHECRQGRHCKNRTRTAEGQWHGAGVERAGTLCRSCEEHAFADIRQLADDYADLAQARTEPTRIGGGPKVSRSAELPVPIALIVDTLMTEIDEEAARWARRLPGDGSDLAVISSHLGTLTDLPAQTVTVWIPHPDGGDDIGDIVLDGVDAVLRLAALHRRAEKLLGHDAVKDSRLTEACHVCGMCTLTVSLQTNLITCRMCKNVWHQDEFTRLNNPLMAA